MSGHTPGPWRVGRPTEYGTFSCGIVTASDGEGVSQILNMPTNGALEELPDLFAEGVANAHLIAAAPDLLAALEDLADVAQVLRPETVGDEMDKEARIAYAQFAIAKARGEQP